MLSIPQQEGRFARFESIEWWDQPLLARSRILVIGAGALGNEIIKNLSLLGIGHLVVADMDRVERSNLCRSVLFREGDEGRFKAECAVEAARSLYPNISAHAFVGNVLSDLGLGFFRWADVVVGALDNREARVFVNSACARVGRPWIDGGIEVLQGVIRGFSPPTTSCYECTMSQVDWDLLNKRRSCSLVARRAALNRGTPTTPTTASIIAAMQVQEVIKFLHRRPTLLGCGIVYDGAEHNTYRVNYPVSPQCPWHEDPAPIESAPDFGQRTKLREIWDSSALRLGGVDAIDFARDIVAFSECPECTRRREVFCAAEKVVANQLECTSCKREGIPSFLTSITADSPLLDRTVGELGLPSWDILWARRNDQILGWEMSADVSKLTL